MRSLWSWIKFNDNIKNVLHLELQCVLKSQEITVPHALNFSIFLDIFTKHMVNLIANRLPSKVTVLMAFFKLFSHNHFWNFWVINFVLTSILILILNYLSNPKISSEKCHCWEQDKLFVYIESFQILIPPLCITNIFNEQISSKTFLTSCEYLTQIISDCLSFRPRSTAIYVISASNSKNAMKTFQIF